MDPAIEILAVHGWGFDGRSWDALSRIVDDGARFRRYDRGYFGSPRVVSWQAGSGTARVLFIHSMGLVFCEELVSRADVIVCFGAFRSFHPDDPDARRRSRRILARMRTRLAREPLSVLRAFHERCGVWSPARPARERDVDVALLDRDLARLDTGPLPVEALARSREIHLLHGERDEIVGRAEALRLAEALGAGAVVRSIPRAGHALPLTHPRECWDRLRPHLSRLGRGG
jgi:pimeloyl-ACP methyl ester carboxylesterase